jgi:hypothetical protein
MAIEPIGKTTWSRLDPALRAELAAVVRAGGDAWHSQYHDAMAWWLLLMLACVGGGAAAAWDLAVGGFSFVEWGSWLVRDPVAAVVGLVRQPQRLGLVAAVVVGVWVGITWARNHDRRGLALTSGALVVVRGNQLRVVRYADVASVERSAHGNWRVARFTVLRLRTRGGATLRLFTVARWADAAVERIDRTTAAASPSARA